MTQFSLAECWVRTHDAGARMKSLTRLHDTLWGGRKPVVGVIHLLPLPGAPGWGGSMEQVQDRCLRDALILLRGGVDGLLVENFMDAPFYPGPVPPETLAAVAVLTRSVVEVAGVPVGVNVLRNDARGALGIAAATGANFIRVNVHTGSMFTDQGLLEGRAHETLRTRGILGAPVAILADVLVKHATPPPGVVLEAVARDAWQRGKADGLIVTGTETGLPVRAEDLRRIRRALPPEGRVWVGSGARPETAIHLLDEAHGLIVGSTFQAGGRAGGGVEEDRVKIFMDALGRG